MLTLSSPELLFKKQKIYHINPHVEKISSERQCRVLIVFDSASEMLPKHLKEMADKMIMACQYKLEDAVYFNANTTKNASLGSLQGQFTPEVLLVFGNVNLGKNIQNVQKNVPYEFNGMNFIYGESLEVLEKNNTEKGELWKALKKMLKL